MTDNWTLTEVKLPKIGALLFGYSPDWVDAKFNEKGTRVCFFIFDRWVSRETNDGLKDETFGREKPYCWMYAIPEEENG